jgi:hypothetical protein
MTTYIYWSIFYFILLAFLIPIVLIVWVRWMLYLLDWVWGDR